MLNLDNKFKAMIFWEDLLGNTFDEVRDIVYQSWGNSDYCIQTDSLGVAGNRCVEFRTREDRVMVIFQKDGTGDWRVIDVFSYLIVPEIPDIPFEK